MNSDLTCSCSLRPSSASTHTSSSLFWAHIISTDKHSDPMPVGYLIHLLQLCFLSAKHHIIHTSDHMTTSIPAKGGVMQKVTPDWPGLILRANPEESNTQPSKE